MERRRNRYVLEFMRVVVEISWWTTVVLTPVQYLISFLKSVGSWTHRDGLGAGSVSLLVPGPPEAGEAVGSVSLSQLPSGPGAWSVLLSLVAVLSVLPALWQLRRVLRAIATRPLDHQVARWARYLAPLIMGWAVVGVVFQAWASSIAAASGVVPGARMYIDGGTFWWGVLAAAAAVIYAESLRVAGELREEQEFTV
ncbi:DUF2975 domain-containing protein [Pseudonocardia sp. KRD291]|uniref:DUF2975 domain-containing protein n=1 Tax=Pseudonocardia sp. KRD291 TaxID=2792007 RepID=UPI001C49E0EF|nr:DUF2975 domain-containing protein [Pseudonocardia sp. KRD291]MBW0105825.1 DUF2975 domain-containing protein [Pseudonocardia sp. KRD291]